MQALNIHRFKGMNNISGRVSEGLATPIFIKDAVPLYTGILQKRPGQEKVIDLINACSIWVSADKSIYVVSDGYLQKLILHTGQMTPLFTVPDLDRISYCQVGNTIYCGNTRWLKAIEGTTSRTVGQSLIDLHNMNWQASDYGKVLYLKNSAGEETVVPHPGEFAHPPEPIDMLAHGFGRLWGVRGSKVFYSYPILVEWWEDSTNFIDIGEEITLIIMMVNGVYVCTHNNTYFLSGKNPEEMSLEHIAYLGGVRNSTIIAPALNGLPKDTPVFMDTDGGVVACLPGGSLKNLTKDILLVNRPQGSNIGSIKIDGVDTLLFKIKEEKNG